MSRLHQLRLRAWVGHFAVAALLLAQSIGLLHGAWHRSGHGPGLNSFVNAVEAPDAAAQASGLFAGHAPDTLDCRLFDHLTHADLALSTTIDTTGDTAAATLALHQPRGHTPAFARSYCARGPPALA